VGLANLGSELEKCVGSRVRLVGVFISFEKNFYRLLFTPPLSGSPYRSFRIRGTHYIAAKYAKPKQWIQVYQAKSWSQVCQIAKPSHGPNYAKPNHANCVDEKTLLAEIRKVAC
jgi:hypothetical protein